MRNYLPLSLIEYNNCISLYHNRTFTKQAAGKTLSCADEIDEVEIERVESSLVEK